MKYCRLWWPTQLPIQGQWSVSRIRYDPFGRCIDCRASNDVSLEAWLVHISCNYDWYWQADWRGCLLAIQVLLKSTLCSWRWYWRCTKQRKQMLRTSQVARFMKKQLLRASSLQFQRAVRRRTEITLFQDRDKAWSRTLRSTWRCS